MKKFKCVVMTFGTLKKVNSEIVIAADVEKARKMSTECLYNIKTNKHKYFIAACPA